ncbi:MD-2-related lipid-recognition protein-like [Contarinia nasturtii]|uniref:MD-2-related lipid-recognition protein-like n=1 Tax=Contarinia nasturtii TaxID=265458 RepID=UPI0012D479A7|nr:MD-2-related lipid-recognition protein-like [Contarinia nasturtii]XP_031638460.1 MD-2-related lipid-recognition protein-like [Contarinia nasturtii]
MASYKFYLVSLCFTWLMCISNAHVVHFQPCAGDCIIHEVRVNPCPEFEQLGFCKLKRGKSATIEFDVTPQWNATKVFGAVYSATDDGDVPLAGMNTNACMHTTCPFIKDHRRYTYSYSLALAKKFPTSLYTIKWVLRNEEKPEPTSEQCCFTTKIKLTK